MSATSIPINCRSTEILFNREKIRLIYLDESEPTLEIQTKLLEINPVALFYTDLQLCLYFIQSIPNEEIFLIISNVISTDILDSICSLRSILAIFIYNDQLKIDSPKVIDICTNQNDLLNSIQEKIHFLEQQSFVYSLFNPKHKLTKDSKLFLWYQILINILKQIPQNEILREEIFNKYSNYYRRNHHELDKIELFRLNYTEENVMKWFKDECFLSKLLNAALSRQDMEVLYSFQVYILDLSCEIERRFKMRKNQEQLIVYRGQMMSNEDIEKLRDHIGCFISINNFLLTSSDKDRALSLLKYPFSTKEYVLFEFHLETILFADISTEQEILFDINTLFQIHSIEYNSIDKLWEIKLITTTTVNHVDEYLKSIQNEIDYYNPMIYFGHLLWNDLGQITQAKIYFQILLKTLSIDHLDIPAIDTELGKIYVELKEYTAALSSYQHALDIHEQHIPKDYIFIASSLNNIGTVYKHMNNLDRAIDFYRQSLDIYEMKCSTNNAFFQRANTITNLGLIYREKHDFDTALMYFTQAYNIYRDRLPNNHLLLGNSLNYIGNIFHDKSNLNQALDYYQQALAIKDLDSSHEQATVFRNIGLIYRDKQEWLNALNYLTRALDLRRRLLSNTNHPDIAICYGDIGHIYEKMKDFDLALENYRRQYQNEEQCFPFNHYNLISHFDLIINILKKTDQSKKAIELCQERLLILKTLLGNDYGSNPNVAHILLSMATMCEDDNPKEADQHYQQALSILENKKHEETLQTCLSPMTNFYWKCRMFDRALVCQMKLLNLRRSTLSSNHNDVAYTLRGLARLYRAMNKPEEALHYFHQSLNILQANYGTEHIDVKDIQKEIFDLKETTQSITASVAEDYHHRRSSTLQKQLPIVSQDSMKSSTSLSNFDMKSKSLSPTLRSAFCIIL